MLAAGHRIRRGVAGVAERKARAELEAVVSRRILGVLVLAGAQHEVAIGPARGLGAFDGRRIVGSRFGRTHRPAVFVAGARVRGWGPIGRRAAPACREGPEEEGRGRHGDGPRQEKKAPHGLLPKCGVRLGREARPTVKDARFIVALTRQACKGEGGLGPSRGRPTEAPLHSSCRIGRPAC